MVGPLLFALPVLTTAAGGLVPDNAYQPLKDKQIMLTCPPKFAARWAPALIEAGAKPTWATSIKTGPLCESEYHQLDDALLRLSDFDHIAFTSRQGIIAVASRLHAMLGIDDITTLADFLRASGARFNAIGSDCLLLKPLLGVTVDNTPIEESSPIGLLKALRGGGPDGDQLSGKSILVPVAVEDQTSLDFQVAEEFLGGLESAGASTILAAPAYKTHARTTENSAEYERLRAGEMDAVILSSSAEAHGLAAGLRHLNVDPVAVFGGGASKTVLVIDGHSTAVAAYEALGIMPHFVSENSGSVEDSVARLGEFLERSGGLIL